MPMSPRLLRPRASGLVLPSDADARAYVLAVNTADGQPLEAPVVQAIDAFVIGCKADGIWSAIKASCLLMGARTLSGALTPLAGTAPTNNNFVSGDYNRRTGLVGNAATKYLNTGREPLADSVNDHHMSVMITSSGLGGSFYIGNASTATGATGLGVNPSAQHVVRMRNSTAHVTSAVAPYTGFLGASRGSSSSFSVRISSATSTVTQAAETTAITVPTYVFARAGGVVDVPENPSQARLSFYSIGSSLQLQLLESRLVQLTSQIQAAIP